VEVSEKEHVVAVPEPARREGADHLDRQAGLVLEVRAVQPGLDLPDEAVRRSSREKIDRSAGDRVLRDRSPETVGTVLLVQQIAVSQEKPPASLHEGLLVADLAKFRFDVGTAQEEVAVAFDVSHRHAGGTETVDGLQKAGDRGGLELRMGDEEMENVAQERDGRRPPAAGLLEGLQKRSLVALLPAHVAVREDSPHRRGKIA